MASAQAERAPRLVDETRMSYASYNVVCALRYEERAMGIGEEWSKSIWEGPERCLGEGTFGLCFED